MAASSRLSIFLLLGFAIASYALHCDETANAGQRPNIVVFLSDDHTWRDSSVYGSKDIPTPNMARLASDGMTFDNAYVASPSCAPSRAALLTGLFPAKNAAEANHSRPRGAIKKLPAYLQELGYEVVSFGKVGHYKQTPEYGFDLARHFNYHEDIAIPEALQWLREHDLKKPLCLFVGSNWPHVPWPENSDGIDPAKLVVPPNHVDNDRMRERRAKYVAAVQKMDQELGQVYDLAREKLGEDTFFLHTSDHGAQMPFAKWNLYDDGIRTPLLVRWPGSIVPGSRTKAMVSWIDILPTLIGVAGGEAPSGIDGFSFLPVLKGRSDRHREAIFTTHSGDGNHNVYPMRGVSTPDGWKYIRNLHPEFRFTSHIITSPGDTGYWWSWVDSAVSNQDARRKVLSYTQRPSEELYHVQSDPYEQKNLIQDPSHTAKLGAMRTSLDGWLASTKDTQTVFGVPQYRADPGKPNVITILIDDMGRTDLSCFGGKKVTTENIDRIAAEGIRFDQFYVNAPICSPSRAALVTGQYPHRWRITSYLNNRQDNAKRGVADWLDPKAPVLARELKRMGYATGHFGKWHLGGQRDVGDAPMISEYGFDRSLTNFEGLGPRVLPLKDAFDGKPPQKHDLGSGELGKGPIRWEDRSAITSSFVREAIQFIDQSQATDQPFFVHVWPDDVHSPFFPPRNLREQSGKGKKAMYYAVLDAMDQQLAPLFERIRNDERLRNNTLIIIASDNGHESGAGESDPFRGGKTMLYEGGVRSPLIVWGPGFVDPKLVGTLNKNSVLCSLDINRSMYSFTGTPLPQASVLDGENLIDTLLGKSEASREAAIFWRRPPDRPGSPDDPNPDLAVRKGNWKAYVNYDGSRSQLFDLASDVSETTDLATRHPEALKHLCEAMQAWNASLPQDSGNAQAVSK
jgi:arylsulfatase A-like enzyme